MTLAYTRCGAGEPLVLLHGLGSSREAWNPVIAALAERFDVLAIDLPGLGESEPISPPRPPTPAALAAAVAALLDELGIAAPHLAGNSLGGWVALEYAGIRPTASVTLLSPAGLWRGGIPLYCRISLRVSRWLTQHAAGLLSRLVAYRLGRILVLGQTHARPSRLSPEYARTTIHAMGTCRGFEATFAATTARGYRSGSVIDAPVTIAFGSADRLLLPGQSRHLDQLPPNTHSVKLPACGHVPMVDNPAAVIALITASAARRVEPSDSVCAATQRDPRQR
jgi:pimeloyl-ACP methyl ester carboxylesterase